MIKSQKCGEFEVNRDHFCMTVSYTLLVNMWVRGWKVTFFLTNKINDFILRGPICVMARPVRSKIVYQTHFLIIAINNANLTHLYWTILIDNISSVNQIYRKKYNFKRFVSSSNAISSINCRDTDEKSKRKMYFMCDMHEYKRIDIYLSL